ncbi:NADP-dependent alcohol dehydrogenase [Streptomyces sp. DSM 42143]|uniref:daptide-type RiPP biosynthesis dehydogenase n=1 Tax=Streptomyces sp. DSM 42143 TaxID=2817711 RepID=UPI002787DE3D|nr:daptide-type RiPP biosynthesis dehydogenase [Streptomyces sp. DSM 42143]MDQ0386402.1 NADP-dependent alcohol dehydrogenase [Streptomyces sp. DSM 42143]
MTPGWHCPTVMTYGGDGLAQWLGTRPERSVALLLDGGVAETGIAGSVRARIERGGRTVRTVVVSGPGTPEAVTELAGRIRDADLVAAVGGGSLLDQAKLAVLLRADPDALARLTVPQRGGLVLLRAERSRGPRLVAVPTTLGTGSELSAVACLAYGRGKRLVMGGALRPDAAVIDPEATATLRAELVAEGVLEVLFRISGSYVGDHRDQPTEDALAQALAERTVRLGNEVRARRALGRAADERQRTEIAKISGLSHAGWVVLNRSPYAGKGWYLANELSSELGLRKMTAVAALLPPLWSAVAAGDTRLGSARRLDALWQRLRAAALDPVGEGPADPPLPEDPGEGIAALIDSWGVGRRITAEPGRLAVVARRSVRAWGAGLPMLDGLGAADIEGLLARAVPDSTPVSL